jgi:2-keto-4-pentenoate hydratase/2-oxohepta-3-ene-1,7-dioic acid hydratase in catechol pathway
MPHTRGDFLAGIGTTAAVASTTAPANTSLGGSFVEPAHGLTFATLRNGGVDRVGVKTARGIVDVRAAAAALGVANPPATVEDVVAGKGNVLALARIAANAPASAILREADVIFGPLVSEPSKIVCVGLNYRAHIAETGEKLPAYPDLFNKFNTALNRHGGTVRVSDLPVNQFDYESELVMIVGKRARGVSEADALNYVFGYTTGNDFSARDAQLRVSQWMTGKTPDEFAPLGPYLVTADQSPDPQTLQIRTFVNDEAAPRQDMNTSRMIFSCAQILSYVSQFMTLVPGDVIFTGTPSGVIVGYPKEKQVWLKPGDRIRTTISSIGELRFTLT